MQTALEKMRDLLDLVDFSEQIFRQNTRRRHPEWSDEQIDKEVRAWYRKRSEGDIQRWHELGADV